EFSLREMLEAAIGPFQSRAELKRIKLTLSIAPTLPETVFGDAPRLRELVSHLIGNAIKFTNAGFVDVRASMVTSDETESKGAERLVMAVHDTGIGIPPEEIEGVFESFRQRDSGFSR